jgi:tRNA 2-thiouridine synthesizing protein A
MAASSSADPPRADAAWHAGDLGCGPLVLQLRQRLRAMPGGVLLVTATDPGAPLDLPAWCGMTGNRLLAHDRASHSYWIESKTEWK